MPTTAVVNSTLAADVLNIKIGQGTALDAANTIVVTPTGPLEEMVIIFANTEGSTNVVTVLAGDNPPADAAGKGDLVLSTIAATTGHVILPPLSSARFLQSDGTVHFTLEASMTGWCQAIQMPTPV